MAAIMRYPRSSFPFKLSSSPLLNRVVLGGLLNNMRTAEYRTVSRSNQPVLVVGIGSSKTSLLKTCIGTMVVGNLATKLNIPLKTIRKAEFGVESLFGKKVILINSKSTDFIALGIAVFKAVDLYKVPLTRIILVHHDHSLKVGQMVHRNFIGTQRDNANQAPRGAVSIASLLGVQKLHRLAVGTYNPGFISPFGRFSPEEEPQLNEAVEVCTEALVEAIQVDDLQFKTQSRVRSSAT